jgi:hypothetical protein
VRADVLVRRWLHLVAADAELSPYLIGLDRVRLARHLTALLVTALDGRPGGPDRPESAAWRGLGLTEAQHHRVLDYLTGVLRAAGLPPVAVLAAAGRAFAGQARP